jgi:hypothetical protein
MDSIGQNPFRSQSQWKGTTEILDWVEEEYVPFGKKTTRKINP